eukprot:CAMPEP_0183300146 /NCGR_PEP_ID=MMETSP0160_2-20130417/6669_1 /TAXON_ID=2839 ORGANISM="Odontella Sinensis, Strain Grunow 1884" /NCGR_SAMPLE_ID=MMETSP0160_2 /ASSEMBLY_ACC=CAM_ASM_000250 /LENGTH=312 /DNA_ID=CAMNT_0025462515 /DNA_START=66 /DNA_END=1004 /DNA_ORIENTATION=-
MSIRWLSTTIQTLAASFFVDEPDASHCAFKKACKADLLDADGLPVVPLPPGLGVTTRLKKWVLHVLVLPVIGPLVLVLTWAKKKPEFLDLFGVVREANEDPVSKLPFYQDTKSMARLWKLPAANEFVSRRALEFQKSEGYCGSATMRCVLKSMGDFPAILLPEQRAAPSDARKWCSSLQNVLEGQDKVRVRTEVVNGDAGYGEFLSVLRRSNHPNCRIVVNYLRGALFGFPFPAWSPNSILLGLFGGHFSPIVGVLDEEEGRQKDDPLVGVFDVNHKYGGVYLIPATRLYSAVNTVDISSGRSRALVLIEMS